MDLKHGDRVVVCDGARFVIYENRGDTLGMDLRVIATETQEAGPAHELGDHPPGRYPGPDDRRSSVEQTDLHKLSEKHFVEALAERLNTYATEQAAGRYVIVADPRSLGILRPKLTGEMQRRVLETITGDYTHRPVEVIEALVTAA